MSLKLAWCSFQAASYAVTHWHYSRRMPNGKLVKIGVWEDGRFVGAIIFGLGATRHLVSPYGLEPHEGCELVRVALDHHKTKVSRILAIALRMLRRKCPGLKLVISYADPSEGHVGSIYKANGWIYLGKTPRDRYPVLDGRIAHPRTLSCRIKAGKVKSRSDVEYVAKPGKHRYAMPLDPSTRASILKISRPYPQASEVGDGRNPTEQRRCDTDPDAPTSHG